MIADARNAIGRLQECFTAEYISETFERDPKLSYTIEVENTSFTWDSPPPDEGKDRNGKKKDRCNTSNFETSFGAEGSQGGALFNLKQIDFKVPHGQLLAIVGAVSCGKTSMLEGLIGNMRKAEGSVRFGGSLAYCPQSAWIQVSFLPRFIQQTETFDRMLQFGKISALVGPSRPSAIGKPCTMPA